MKTTSKSARKAARKLFPKAKHTTRPFTSEDYKALPKDGYAGTPTILDSVEASRALLK
jgi:hypothetical protein